MSGECDDCGRHALDCECHEKNKMGLPEITKEEFLEAIENGIKIAFLTMMEAGDGYNGLIIREPILEAIENGIKSGMYIAMPTQKDIKDIYFDAVNQAYRDKDN